MKKPNKQMRRHYVVYVAGFLAALLVGVYVWMVILTNGYQRQIVLTQEELLVQVERERRVRDTAGVLASFKDERQLAKTFFKNPDDVISVIEDVEGFARIVGVPVSVVQVQVENEDQETREGTLVMSIASEGSWSKMTHLIGLLDTLPYQASVTQATLDTSESVEGGKSSSLWVARALVSVVLKK